MLIILSEDLEILKDLLLTKFLETSVLLRSLVDNSSSLNRLSEDTI